MEEYELFIETLRTERFCGIKICLFYNIARYRLYN